MNPRNDLVLQIRSSTETTKNNHSSRFDAPNVERNVLDTRRPAEVGEDSAGAMEQLRPFRDWLSLDRDLFSISYLLNDDKT